MASFDILLTGADIYDGSGAEPVAGDVGIVGDRIAHVGATTHEDAARVIDVRGRAVAPGFIDVHTHDDFAVLVDPEFPCKTLQGVTTAVVGNCGFGAAPFDAARDSFGAWHPEIATWKGWDGYGGYLDAIDAAPPSLNIATLVAHGVIRKAVLGDEQRAPSPQELANMRALVREGMESGALGMSTGLIYEPGRYADTDEVRALTEEVAAAGGMYVSHIRNEAGGLLGAVTEAISIGRAAGTPVQISHHKASGRDNWGKVRESLALIEEARAQGHGVTADQYPYTSGSTNLSAVVQNGGLSEEGGSLGRVPPEAIRLCYVAGRSEWEGQTLAAIARSLDLKPLDAANHILEESGGAAVVALDTMSEDDVRTVLAHPTTMIGSDGLATGSKPHPRLWGTFPRVLGRYGRDEKVLSLAEAVHRMTGLPAATFGLSGRGSLEVGRHADLVVFDPDTVLDVATFEEPCVPPTGVEMVVVNGSVVVEAGRHTGARPGRALRSS